MSTLKIAVLYDRVWEEETADASAQDKAPVTRTLDKKEVEEEVVEALQDCIPFTGQEGRSEALEHRLEHMIMRKQEQRDTLERAARES